MPKKMNKISKRSKYLILIILLGALSFPLSVFATGLVVDFETTPLFNESNFTPGDLVERWAKVTNTSGETKTIITEAINMIDGDGFGDVLNIEIKEGTTSLYIDTLTNFFNLGELSLSDVATGSTQQYDYIISFLTGATNEYQADNLGFDILIGFEGEESVVSGGGGAVVLPRGLSIFNEGSAEVQDDSVTIVWNTNYDSTSQVIYSLKGGSRTINLLADNYGYDYVALDPEDLNKVKNHSVIILGLSSETTYYYRCVSHASPATIGQERIFTTLAVELPLQPDAEPISETGGIVEETGEGENFDFPTLPSRNFISNFQSNPNDQIFNEDTEETKTETGDLTEIVQDIIDEGKTDSNLGANLINFVKNIPWWVLVVIAFILFLLALLTKKKKEEK